MLIKNSKNLWALLILLLLAGSAVAQKDKPTHATGPAHGHKSTHGGTVKSAGDYHIELVERSNQYHIYLMDVSFALKQMN